MPSIAIIIPCYNEAARLQPVMFQNFISLHPDVQYFFVDDGSTDNTAQVLQQIKNIAPSSVIIPLRTNVGKGAAVQTGMLQAMQSNFLLIGYLDADLSTSLESFYEIGQTALHNQLDMALASRIKKIDTVIERSFLRHIIGRIIATIIDKHLQLGVYDTQCGAKVFTPAVLQNVLEKPFYTSWFFDVELICRIKKQHPQCRAQEIPLAVWRNVKDSKIGLLSFPKIIKELLVLLSKY